MNYNLLFQNALFILKENKHYVFHVAWEKANALGPFVLHPIS